MKKNRLFALGMAAAVAVMSMTGCGSKNSQTKETETPAGQGDSTAAAPSGSKEKITLRIGSGHSESNPWITALEDYFVKNVTERVSTETNYEIDWVKSYGGSVISLGNELQGCRTDWWISDVRFSYSKHPGFRFRIWFTACLSPVRIL